MRGFARDPHKIEWQRAAHGCMRVVCFAVSRTNANLVGMLFCVALATACALNGIIGMAAGKIPAGNVLVGLPHVDLLVYYACARETYDEHTLLRYATPYTSDSNSPRIYSQFAFLLMGLVWQVAKLSILHTDQLLRACFGGLTLFMGALVLRRALPVGERNKPVGIAGSLLIMVGGGLAWAAASWNLVWDWAIAQREPADNTTFANWVGGWPDFFARAESGYGEWGASPVRVLFSVPECIYHVLFFGCVLALLVGQRWMAIALLALTWWSHPFTGMLLGSIVVVYLGICLRTERRVTLPLACAIAIQVFFVMLYALYLPHFREHASVVQQMSAFSATMLFSKMLNAYGVFLVLPLLCLPRWRRVVEDNQRVVALMATWLVCNVLLLFSDRFMAMPLQPMHFSRGYLYVPLVYFSVRGLEHWAGMKQVKWQLGCAAGLMLVHLPDSVVFARQFSEGLKTLGPEFSISKDAAATMRALDRIGDTLTIHVLPSARLAGVEGVLPVLTHHRALMGHSFNTPFVARKRELAAALDSNVTANLPVPEHVNALVVGVSDFEKLGTVDLPLSNPLQLAEGRYLVHVPSDGRY